MVEFSKGGGGQLSDICSAETRGQAGSWPRSRRRWHEAARVQQGRRAGSRRWMALTENRLLKQHDISWNESTHTLANTHSLARRATPSMLPCTQTGTPSLPPLPSSYSVTSLYLTISHLTLQVFSKPPCPAWNCRFKDGFI